VIPPPMTAIGFIVDLPVR